MDEDRHENKITIVTVFFCCYLKGYNDDRGNLAEQ